MFAEALIDEIRRITFVGCDETPEIVERHRRTIGKMVRAVADERAKGRSDDLIRRAMLNAARHQMEADGVTEDSPQYETEFARADRSVRACLALTRDYGG